MLKKYTAIVSTLCLGILTFIVVHLNNNDSYVQIQQSPVYIENYSYLDNNIQIDAMAKAIYFETFDLGFNEKLAVGNVIKNRLRDGNYGLSYISVVYSGCQFSFVCERKDLIIRSQTEWDLAVKAARMVHTGQVEDNTKGAVFYVNHKTASKKGAKFFTKLQPTVKIGKHQFYKEK